MSKTLCEVFQEEKMRKINPRTLRKIVRESVYEVLSNPMPRGAKCSTDEGPFYSSSGERAESKEHAEAIDAYELELSKSPAQRRQERLTRKLFRELEKQKK
jgi:hypothetical protein